MFDLVIVTHIPVFYKVNLYNEIAKNKCIFVIFVANDTCSKRSNDFITIDEAAFKYTVLSVEEFENRKIFGTLKKIREELKKIDFRQIIVSGWDLVEFWYIVFTNKKKKIALALESTAYESQVDGIKGGVKKLFLSRISKVYASGSLHSALLEKLNYQGKVVITKGVGIIRKPEIKYKKTTEWNYRIVYLGRLSQEKNLEMAIRVVNEFPWLCFDLYGVGPEENALKAIANDNIHFYGAIPNAKVQEVFKDADFLILPSKSETWGLVVEEALYFDLPVIVSNRCGVSEIVKNGFVLNFDDFDIQLYSLLEKYGKGQLVKLDEENVILIKDKDQIDAY